MKNMDEDRIGQVKQILSDRIDKQDDMRRLLKDYPDASRDALLTELVGFTLFVLERDENGRLRRVDGESRATDIKLTVDWDRFPILRDGFARRPAVNVYWHGLMEVCLDPFGDNP